MLEGVRNSFIKATRGEEKLTVVIWWWGVISYLLSYFVVHKLIMSIDSRIFDFIVSFVMVTFFSWHSYVTKKCAPKKPKLTDEEKKKLKQAKDGFAKSFTKKLLLQEPITKWDPVFTVIMIDILCITHFFGFFFK
jgi:hypothetical protein